MAHSLQRLVLVSRSGVDVDSNARKVAGKSLGCDAEAIGKGCDFVEFDRILYLLSVDDLIAILRIQTFSSATTVARPLLPAHNVDLVSDEEAC